MSDQSLFLTAWVVNGSPSDVSKHVFLDYNPVNEGLVLQCWPTMLDALSPYSTISRNRKVGQWAPKSDQLSVVSV